MKLTVLAPAHNEAANLAEFIRRTNKVLKTITKDYEILIVDDGSTDGSWKLLEKLKNKFIKLKAVRLRRRSGQTTGIMSGFKRAQGVIVVVMDADLQQDPNDIPRLIKPIIENKADVVSGWRQKRQHSITIRLIAIMEKVFNRWLLGIRLNDTAVSPNAYRKGCLANLSLYGEMHRFLVPILIWRGYRVVEIPVSHYSRRAGQSHYKVTKAFGGFLDLLIVKFWQDYASRPIRLFGSIGLWILFLGVAIGGEEAIRKLVFHLSIYNRTLPLLAAFLAIVGLQFLILGILADIMVRIYYQGHSEDSIEKVLD